MTAVTEPAGMSGPAKGSERAGSGGVLPPVSAEFADAVDERLVRQLAGRAGGAGLSLTGEGGLLQRLTKIVLEGALEGEMDAHLGYARHDPAGRDGGNSRNGRRAKTVLTDIGPAGVEVPRDRDASFEPRIVAKRQRRLAGVNDLVVSLADGPACRRGRRAPGGDLRHRGLPGDHQQHHRPGAGRPGRMAVPAAGPGCPGDLH